MAMQLRSRPVLMVTLGLVFVAAVVSVVVTLVIRPRPRAIPYQQPDVVEEFISAYQRSLEASFAVEGEFTRTMADGRSIRSGLLIAQRPPDWIRRQFGGLSGAVGGRELNCSTTPDGAFSCPPGPEATPYEQEVKRRVGIVRSYFDPASPPLYRVTVATPDCFRLDLLRPVPDPTFGNTTTLCFDETTGAQTSFELHRFDGSVDRIEAVVVRNVTDLDFVIARDTTFDQRNDDLQGATSGVTSGG